MEQSKPQRRTNIFDYYRTNKQIKLTKVLERSPQKAITRFEDLSNELFYDVFNYLDVYDVYKAFYNLNIRLQSLLINTTLPLNINISSMSKSSFQNYHRHMIMPNKHRITSLSISNPFVVDLIFSPVRIASSFTRLEKLIFNNIKSKYLVNILHHCASLHNLTSLIIIPIDHVSNRNDLCATIFRLPKLKYCEMSLIDNNQSNSLTISANIASPVEHLVINNTLDLNELNALLTYVPQLRRLTCRSLWGNDSQYLKTFSDTSNNLTHVYFDTINIDFNQLEQIIRSLFKQLQVLHISTDNDREYLDANRWEHLILSYMPYLRIFDFQYMGFVDNDINQMTYDSIINQFSSLFWYDRKWFFKYQLDLKEYRNLLVFGSTNPYRRKQYTLYKLAKHNVRKPSGKKNLNSVNYLEIQGEDAMTSCVNYFPNTTKLTLSKNFNGNSVCLELALKRIVYLTQLTTLVIECYDFNFEQLIKLLHSTPNLHTLAYNCVSTNEINMKSIQQNELFRLISSKNMIKNVKITTSNSLENIKLLIALCPQMQYFAINRYRLSLESMTEFVLSKSKAHIQHLCLLCIKNTTRPMVAILKTLIESEGLLDNYVIKYIDSDIYIWW
ncbi:unnamed protein product [Adineta steineri]|uniref:F-box domain-containing protein n=1 Tax=Adineta steineri TaxID=433720 RepID=A0A814TE29_9BILA|nr:unnamed protein product [Adineta steineri]